MNQARARLAATAVAVASLAVSADIATAQGHGSRHGRGSHAWDGTRGGQGGSTRQQGWREPTGDTGHRSHGGQPGRAGGSRPGYRPHHRDAQVEPQVQAHGTPQAAKPAGPRPAAPKPRAPKPATRPVTHTPDASGPGPTGPAQRHLRHVAQPLPSALRGAPEGENSQSCTAAGCRIRGVGSPGGTDRQEILGARRSGAAPGSSTIPRSELGLDQQLPPGLVDQEVLGTHQFFIPIGTPLPTTGQGLLWFLLGGGLLTATGFGLRGRVASR